MRWSSRSTGDHRPRCEHLPAQTGGVHRSRDRSIRRQTACPFAENSPCAKSRLRSRCCPRRSRQVMAPSDRRARVPIYREVTHALVTGSTSFAAVRFLGVAEAGFFPGIILYFTYWFPSRHHARIVSGFLIGNPSLRSVRRSASSAAARLSSRRPAVAGTSAKSPRNGV